MLDKERLKRAFVQKAKLVQDQEYDYSSVVYVDNKTKVCIICPIHGEFWVRPNDFLSGHMCKYCGIERRAKKRTKGKQAFITNAKEIFPQYDFSKADYINAHTKVCIICPKHGEFWITPNHLLNGHGCKKCAIISTHDKQRKGLDDFIKESNKVHGSKYNYSKAVYKGFETKVCIICPIHGEFWQTPHSHLSGQGCPACAESKLEKEMANVLIKENVKFEREKKFSWLGLQSLDFYLPEHKIAIECQGIQHFKVVEHFGGEKGFEYRKNNDAKKLKLCTENGIKLLYYSSFEYPNVYKDTNKLINIIKNGF
jgi:very-short-patch-repair endonuclease